MMRTELTNTRTTGIDAYHSTMLTLLLELNVICGQKWIEFEWQNSLSRAFVIVGKIALPFSKSVAAIGSPERHMRKALHYGSKQQ